jgi:hypothetical protein
MTTKTKLLAFGTAMVAVIGFGAYAIAQHGPGMGRMGHGMGPGATMGKDHGSKSAGMGDPTARLATLKTELGIKPEQQADWAAYVRVVTETAAAGRTLRESVDRDAVHKMEANDRQAFMTSMQERRGKQFEVVKTAAETLLAKLDDAQKAKARETLPGLGAGLGAGMRQGMKGGHGKGQH